MSDMKDRYVFVTDNKDNWQCIGIRGGQFDGVVYKYGKITIPEPPEKDIEKDLVDMGYQILAISPESPERLQEQKLETEFLVTLLSDDKLDTIREFGVGFYLDTVTELKYKTYGINLTKDESGNSVLPAPSIFMLNKKGQVLFSYVNPDFKVRPSADLVLAVAKTLKKEM